MKNQAISLFPLMLLLLQLSSCGERLLNGMKITSEDQRAEIVYSTLVPSEDTNKSITLILDPFEKNELRTDSEICLQIDNQSTDMIWFPVGYNVTFYRWIKETASWKEIKNVIKYFGKNRILGGSEEGRERSDFSLILAKPDLVDLDENVKLRVSVSGYVYKDGQPTDQLVSAYLDVELTP